MALSVRERVLSGPAARLILSRADFSGRLGLATDKNGLALHLVPRNGWLNFSARRLAGECKDLSSRGYLVGFVGLSF
jgi:hypothetical protein